MAEVVFDAPTIGEIESALFCIGSDLPRDDWARIGMAIKSELGDAGFDLFDTWSQGAGDLFSAEDVRSTWRSINGGGGIKIATLFHFAIKAGYEPEKKPANLLVDETARLKRQQERQAADELEEAAKRKQYETAALDAQERWNKAKPATDHPYLVRKGIKPHGARQEGDSLLIPMRDADRSLRSIQTIAPNGTKKFAKGGKASGMYAVIPGISPLIIAEGFATAASINEATGCRVAIAFSCGNLGSVAQQLRNKHPDEKIIIAGDSEPASTTEKARQVAKDVGAGLAIPSFPEGETGSDFNDLHQVVGYKAVRLQIKKASAPNYKQSSEWAEPIPLESYSLPEWPENAFPEPFNSFVVLVAHSVEVPIEVSFMDVLTACSAAVHGKFQVMVKPGYVESLNIWGMPVQPPATRKTRVKRETMLPIIEWERESYAAVEHDIKANQSERKTLFKRIDAKRNQAAKAKTDDDYRQRSKEVADLEDSVPDEIRAPRVWTEDITPETLGTLMAENNQCMSILSAEGGIFGIMAGRYSKGAPNIDIFLKGHAGEPVRVDRGSRDPVFMDNPCITIGLSVQPEVLLGLAQTREFRGRGLLGRFLYVFPHNNLGTRTGNTRSVDGAERLSYSSRIKTLLNKTPATDVNGEAVPHTITLTDGAYSAWYEFWREVESMLADCGELAHCRDWGGKLPGAVARIAGVFHCARHATVHIEDHKVSGEDMASAVRVGRALIPHALKVFDSMRLDEARDDARIVLGWIRRGGLLEFATGDCLRNHRSRFPKIEDLNPALRVLEDMEWIRARETARKQGRPSRIYDVNPSVKNNGTT